jgi:hypothetical protein
MTDCIIKAFGGCACQDGECAEKPATIAPVIIPSLRTQAITCLFLGAVMTFVSAAVMEMHYRDADRVQQEVTRNVVSR